jgi:hypothetical protein
VFLDQSVDGILFVTADAEIDRLFGWMPMQAAVMESL